MKKILFALITIALVSFVSSEVLAEATAAADSDSSYTRAYTALRRAGGGIFDGDSCNHTPPYLRAGANTETCGVFVTVPPCTAGAYSNANPGATITLTARAVARGNGLAKAYQYILDTSYIAVTAVKVGNTLQVTGTRELASANVGRIGASRIELAVLKRAGGLGAGLSGVVIDTAGDFGAGYQILIDSVYNYKGTQVPPTLSWNVDVTGVPAGDIIVFAFAHYEPYWPAIPTLSEWALIIFSVVLLGLMTFYVIKRRRLARAAV